MGNFYAWKLNEIDRFLCCSCIKTSMNLWSLSEFNITNEPTKLISKTQNARDYMRLKPIKTLTAPNKLSHERFMRTNTASGKSTKKPLFSFLLLNKMFSFIPIDIWSCIITFIDILILYYDVYVILRTKKAVSSLTWFLCIWLELRWNDGAWMVSRFLFLSLKLKVQ